MDGIVDRMLKMRTAGSRVAGTGVGRDLAMARLLLVLACFLAGGRAFGQEVKGLAFTGENSTDAVYTVADPWSGPDAWLGADTWDSGRAYRGLSSFRLDARGGDRQASKVEASAVLRLAYGVAAEPIVLLDLKKLYASVYFDAADLSVGRMIVNYGRGTVFSPVDLFAEVDTGDLALGRSGTDAVRLFVPLGDFSGLDLVGTLAKSPKEAIFGGRGNASVGAWDVGASLFRDGGDRSRPGALVFGLDAKGDIEAGFSAEALARIPWTAAGLDGGNAAFSAMAGLDYSLRGTWFFDFEYLSNFGPGRAAGTFQGAHTLFGSLSYKADELSAIDVRSLWNPGESSWQASLSAGRSIAPRSQLLFYLQYASGDVRANGAAPARDALSFGLRLSVAF